MAVYYNPRFGQSHSTSGASSGRYSGCRGHPSFVVPRHHTRRSASTKSNRILGITFVGAGPCSHDPHAATTTEVAGSNTAAAM